NKREGAEQCDGTDRGSCSADQACSGCECVSQPAECGDGEVEGNEECESDNDCGSGQTCDECMCWDTPQYCGDGIKNGNEQCDGSSAGCDGGGVCSTGCSCVYPPMLNCDYICSLTSGALFIAGGLSSESQCMSAATSVFPSRTCYTTCKYAWFYKVDNLAGFASCCCAMKKEFACSDCPGQNPVCPASGTICPANAPSWQSPS
ncbi:hypothetical protein L0Y65_03225, partial [Candidatus Micrarchaeota archaeon]|nr:hypothetical protein [Candidatus Micrarchaeota archaeon]